MICLFFFDALFLHRGWLLLLLKYIMYDFYILKIFDCQLSIFEDSFKFVIDILISMTTLLYRNDFVFNV